MKICLIIILLFNISKINAHDALNYWLCSTADKNYHEWIAKENDKIQAINQSFFKCKQFSKIPDTCKTSPNNCEQFVNGNNVTPKWKCVALDQNAQRWLSNEYNIRDDAAIAALAYCKQKSLKPDTCYINLITCTKN